MGEMAAAARKRFRNCPSRTTAVQARSAAPEMERDMYDNDTCGSEHRGRERARLRRAGLAAAALVCLALVAAACSSGAKTGTGAGPAHGSARHSELAFSRCMRAHGISDFPDPNPQGGLELNAGSGTGLDPKSPRFKAAWSACRPLLPAQQAMSPAQQAAAKAQALKYAQCMRAHGISDFPDPNSQGQLQIQAQPGSDLNPNNPRFQAANKACEHDLPGKDGSFSTNTSGSSGGGS
jgi:hypothetical protein